MKTYTENYLLFEAYAKDKLDRHSRIKFLERMQRDSDFYKEFQLWVNIENYLDEMPTFQIEKAIEIVEKDSKIIPVGWGRYINYKIAVSFAGILLIGVGLYKYFDNTAANLYTKQIIFSQKNIPEQGRGAFSKDSSNVVYKDVTITAEKINQPDTTYQFTYEPFMFKFRLPKIEENLGEKTILKYDYKKNQYILFIDKKTYPIIETKLWKKLLPTR